MITNPFRYRPIVPVDSSDGEVDDWEDNWLSNFLAWASDKTGFSKVCASPSSPLVKIVNYLFTTCPCCLFARGAAFGVIFTLAVVRVLAYIGI